MTRAPGSERRPLVIAHRGASAYRPENTLSAYALAIEQRADMIEIDLHCTRDGEVVVCHDHRLDRLGGTGEVADATLEAVRALELDGDERVPILDEVLDRFGQRIAFNLELKRGGRGDYRALPALALAAVDRRGLLPTTLFSSFQDETLAALRAEAPAARIGLLVEPRHADDAVGRALRLGAEAVNPYVALATAELVAAAHEAGLAVHVFTVDDPEVMGQLLDRGVDGIFTNVPDVLRTLVDARST